MGDEFWVRIESGVWLHVTCCGDKGFLRGEEGNPWHDGGSNTMSGDESAVSDTSLAIILQDPMEPLDLDRFDERISANGLLATVQRPVESVLKATPLTHVFVISVSSSHPDDETLIWLDQTGRKIDQMVRPEGEAEIMIWTDPFSNEGLVECQNIEGGEWWELDEQRVEKGDRWDYSYNGSTYQSKRTQTYKGNK